MSKTMNKTRQSVAGRGLRAGAAKVDVTCVAGETAYGRYPEKAMAHIPPQYRDMKVVVDDPLYVRVLVLDDGEEKIVLATIDCCAIGARTTSQQILYDNPDDFMERVRERVENELGIPGDRVSVSASHTHPPGRLLCDDEEQVSRTVTAIRQALDAMVPVAIGAGAGQENTLTFNRTWIMKDDTDWSWRPEPPGGEIKELRPIDPEIGIVRIDRLDGTPLAVLYNFASHLLVGCRKGNVTADFPGVTSGYIEEQLGADVIAVFLQGANGDAVEIFYDDRENPHDKFDFGYKLGRGVMRAYRAITPGSAAIGMATREISFPLRRDIPGTTAELKMRQAELTASLRYVRLSFKTFLPLYIKYSMQPDFPNHLPHRYLAADACGDDSLKITDEQNRKAIDTYLQGIRAMERMAANELKIATLEKHQEIIEALGGETVAAEIKAIRIGECLFIAAPMEVLTEVGFKVKKLSPFKFTYIISNANGYLHYAPPASYYGRGGYETTECLLAPEWEAIFMDTLRELFAEFS